MLRIDSTSISPRRWRRFDPVVHNKKKIKNIAVAPAGIEVGDVKEGFPSRAWGHRVARFRFGVK